MTKWVDAPVIGGAYSDDTRPWSVQDTVNWIPVAAERPGTRSMKMLRGAPGLVTFADLGTSSPIRGMRNVEGLLLVVSGNKLFKVSPQGGVTLIGTIPGVSRVSMAHNQITGGNQVAIANGVGGYVYNTVTGVLSPITDEAFPGSKSFDYADSYITGIEPGGRFAFTSDLADATSYSTLDRYEAEGSPDLIVGQIVTHREWWIFGQRTIETYQNTGAATTTWQRSTGTVLEVGAASPFAMVNIDNSVVFLGNDGILYRANGYTPVRISTAPVEQAIAECDLSKAFMFTYEDRGHKIVYLTFQDGKTWGYDISTQEIHRRKSSGLDRWRINALVQWNGMWIAGDYQNGRLCRLDWNVQQEDGQVLERRRITGVLHDSQNDVIVNALALVLDTGQPSAITPPFLGVGANGVAVDSDGLVTISGNFYDNVCTGDLGHVMSLTSSSVRVRSFDSEAILSSSPNANCTTAWSSNEPPILDFSISPSKGGSLPAFTLGLGSLSYDPALNYIFDVTLATNRGTAHFQTSLEAASYNTFWWMTSNDSNLSINAELTDWTGFDRTSRSPFVNLERQINIFGGGYQQVNDTVLLGVSQNPVVAERVTNVDPYIGPITTELVTIDETEGVRCSQFRVFGGVAVAIIDNSDFYYTSIDGGSTWVKRIFSGMLGLYDIARLSTGRWIMLTAVTGGTTGFYYSDDVAPEHWTLGTPASVRQSYIATNGTMAVQVGDGKVWRTTDGIHWTGITPSPSPSIVGPVSGGMLGNTIILGDRTSGNVTRSEDAGLTWQGVTITDAIVVNQIVAFGSMWVASCQGSALFYSLDDGLTWAQAIIPDDVTDIPYVCPVRVRTIT